MYFFFAMCGVVPARVVQGLHFFVDSLPFVVAFLADIGAGIHAWEKREKKSI